MNILISNDDGVHAPGLKVLAEALAIFGDIVVVAPDRDRSAASNSLTLDRPLKITQQPSGFYAVNGTPTDSVHIAITGWLDKHPDMVVAGINAGSNLGDDVIYSGTVAAAMEGRFLGFPAMAISLVTLNKTERHYETAGIVAQLLIKNMHEKPLAKDTILNINVPNLPWEEIKGFKVTRLGNRHIAEKIIPSKDPHGNTIYWVGPAGKEQDAGPDTDFYAVNNGYVSITPLKVDLTDNGALRKVGEWTNFINENL